jgi:hypothetical protein
MNVRPWELVHKLSENGLEASPFTLGQRKCEKYERKCKKSS